MILPRPVAPKVRESLAGFVMRAAEQNSLRTLGVMHAVVGRQSHPPDWTETRLLADFCRCSVAEINQLFGFQVRRSDGVWAWRLGDEWLTKPQFVSSRAAAVCPECLRRESYLPGTWELTLYRCCAFHRTRMLSRCPNCGKTLRWTRPRLWQCTCSYDLRRAHTTVGNSRVWTTAQLIEHRLESSLPLTHSTEVPKAVIERLATLSLDGLCKTLWFLGHFVAGVETRADGHKRLKRREGYVEAMIDEAFRLLGHWPEALREKVEMLSRQPDPLGRQSLYQRIFKPLMRYLEEELPDQELTFLRFAYEQQLRRLWRSMGRKMPKDLDHQMELELDG